MRSTVMRIGIDARKIKDFGVGKYIENLIRYVPEFDQENEYVIFHYPEDEGIVPQSSHHIRLVPDTSPKYSLRELMLLPIKMGQQRLDLFHATHYTLPPLRPCKGIVTIHDVIHLRFPEYLPHPIAAYYARGMMWTAAKSAAKILTVSECSKRDIMQYLGVPEHKIVVTYNGINIPADIPLEKGEKDLHERFGISRPYLLYVGNFMPHKNLDTLIKAYNLLKRQHHIPHCLVLAGKNERLRQQLEALITARHLQDDVILTGFVEEELIPMLYAQAALFVYPSVYEGFGLQALEAMAYHIPVVVSNVSSLPEIAGDAALQFDPVSVDSMANTIYKVLTDQTLRTELIKKGEQRVQQFSWRELARKTVEVYHASLQSMVF